MSSLSSPSAALQWLRTGQAPLDRVSEVARALALLSGEVPLAPAVLREPLTEDLELALLAEAEGRAMHQLVLLLRDHGHSRKVAKEARKALFRAKQRGVQVPERLDERAAVSLARRPEPLPSYCSSYDGLGHQILLHGGWSETDGPFALVAFLSDVKGLESVNYFPNMSRTRQRQLLEDLQRRFVGLVVEVAERFSAGRIRWALDVSDHLQRVPDGDVGVARRLVQGVDPIAEIELNLDPEDEALVPDRIDRGLALAEDPCFKSWLPLADEMLDGLLKRIEEDLAGAEDLPEEELDARLRSLRDSYVSGAFDIPARHRMAARLDLSAWLLARLGQRETALLAIASARGLRDDDRDATALPFVRRLVDRYASIEALMRFAREGRRRDPHARDARP